MLLVHDNRELTVGTQLVNVAEHRASAAAELCGQLDRGVSRPWVLLVEACECTQLNSLGVGVCLGHLSSSVIGVTLERLHGRYVGCLQRRARVTRWAVGAAGRRAQREILCREVADHVSQALL